jgi:hypothetical protein
MARLGDIEVRTARGSYAGFAYDDEANVIKLLGGDPALPDRNEVIQSNALGARSASFDVVVTSEEDRDSIEALLFSQTTWESAELASSAPMVRDVVVTKARVRIPIYTGAEPQAWVIELGLRECTPTDSS